MTEIKPTEEIIKIFSDGYSAEVCRNNAICMVFSTKRAIKFEGIARKKYNKAWELIHELYPVTKTGGYSYDHDSTKIEKVTGE